MINSHLVHANILTRLLRLAAPLPRLVSSAHNTNEEGCGRMVAYRLTDRLADISTNVSEEAVAAFEQQGALRRGRMIAIHNGIDTEAFTFDPAGRERVRRSWPWIRIYPCSLRWGVSGNRKITPICYRLLLACRMGATHRAWPSLVMGLYAMTWR